MVPPPTTAALKTNIVRSSSRFSSLAGRPMPPRAGYPFAARRGHRPAPAARPQNRLGGPSNRVKAAPLRVDTPPMRFRSRIAALSALLVLSALLGVVASARAAVPAAPAGNGQA